MVDYSYVLSFIGSNFTGDGTVPVSICLKDDSDNPVDGETVFLTSDTGQVLTGVTDSDGLVCFTVVRSGQWTASVDLEGSNTTYRTVTVNHTISVLYNALMDLVNQQYYKKSEINTLISSLDVLIDNNGFLYIGTTGGDTVYVGDYYVTKSYVDTLIGNALSVINGTGNNSNSGG